MPEMCSAAASFAAGCKLGRGLLADREGRGDVEVGPIRYVIIGRAAGLDSQEVGRGLGREPERDGSLSGSQGLG